MGGGRMNEQGGYRAMDSIALERLAERRTAAGLQFDQLVRSGMPSVVLDAKRNEIRALSRMIADLTVAA